MANQETKPGVYSFCYQFHAEDNPSTATVYLSSGHLIVEVPVLGLQTYRGFGVDSFGAYFLEGVQTRTGQLAGLKWYGDLRNHFTRPPIGQLLEPRGDCRVGKYFLPLSGGDISVGTIAAFRLTSQSPDAQALEIDLPHYLPRPVRHFASTIHRFDPRIVGAMQEICSSFPASRRSSR